MTFEDLSFQRSSETLNRVALLDASVEYVHPAPSSLGLSLIVTMRCLTLSMSDTFCLLVWFFSLRGNSICMDTETATVKIEKVEINNA